MNLSTLRRLGRSDLNLPRLGLGGAPLGDLYEQLSEFAVRNALDQAYSSGIRYFDTAPWYGHGLSEHRIGLGLRHKPREEFLLGTKVGRVYRRPRHTSQFDTAPWAGGLPFELRFDYSADGILRSYEDSLLRLGLNRVDYLAIHDLDFGYHPQQDTLDRYFGQLEDGGFALLEELKNAGEISAIGAGINDATMIEHFLDRFAVDFFIVAMPYTLLDQSSFVGPLHRCVQQGVGVIIGSPFASGILATGPIAEAKYNYAPASAEVIEKTRRIEAVCNDHHVPLPAVALQFPLAHPAVASVIPGAISAEQISELVKWLQIPIPDALWHDLREAGLVARRAPVLTDAQLKM